MIELTLGGLVVVLTCAFVVDRVAAGRPGGPRLFRSVLSTDARWVTMLTVCAAALALVIPALIPAARRGLFSFCTLCPIVPGEGGGPLTPGGFVRDFLLASWYYAATVVPVFVLACLLSGFLVARRNRLVVTGFARSFAVAALLPLCSCGVVPMAQSMIDRGGRGVRDGIVFLSAAPLLSPIVILMGFRVLGPTYVALRIIGSLVLAATAAWVVSPLLRDGPAPRESDTRHSEPPRKSVPRGAAPARGEHGSSRAETSAVLAGWGMLTRLFRFVLYGVVLGAKFVASLPESIVPAVVRAGFPSLAASAVVGVPISMCAGEEILLLGPLVGLGLPLGHALTFSLASTGICISSIPLLVAVLGRRAALALIAVFLVVPVAVGLAVNALI